MPMFEVNYQVGQREPNSGTFQGQNIWYKMVVEAWSLNAAQQQVEAMNGGRERCLIGATFQKS